VKYEDPRLRRLCDHQQGALMQVFERAEAAQLEALTYMPVEFWDEPAEERARFRFGRILGVDPTPNGCLVRIGIPSRTSNTPSAGALQAAEEAVVVHHRYLRLAPFPHPTFKSYAEALSFYQDVRSRGDQQDVGLAHDMVIQACQRWREAWEQGLPGERPEFAPVRPQDLGELTVWNLYSEPDLPAPPKRHLR